MNKSVAGIVVVVILVLAGGGILLAKNHKDDNKNTNSTNATSDMNGMDMSSTNSSNSSTPAKQTNNVTIQNFAFSPANITVKKGTTVTWSNQDSTIHDITESDGKKGPESGTLAPDKTYSFTFNTTGTFKYICSIHPNMTGSVTVTD